jgi:osmotically-inducible protein OsmY
MTGRFTLPARARPLVAGSLAAMTLLAGCAPVIVGVAVVGGAMIASDRRSSGAQLDDEVIERKAKGRLAEAIPDERAAINTNSYNRMVLLSGEVPNEADKITAEQVVARIDTVLSVVNELTVGQPETFKERTNDSYITTMVKASLVDAKDLLANSIKIVTHRNVVYLMGRVSEQEANRATEIARGVSGVRKVVRVFEILTPAEAAALQAKSQAAAASAASAPARPASAP